jgi:hypothetical protein
MPQAHGDADLVVSYKRGLTTNQLIQRSVKTQKLITYPGERLSVPNMGNHKVNVKIITLAKYRLSTCTKYSTK